MHTVTHATPTNPSDRERAERIAKSVAMDVRRTFEPMNGPTRAVHFHLALERFELVHAARGAVLDAMTAALARLLADERAALTTLEDAGEELRKLVEAQAPEETSGLYLNLAGYTLDNANWPCIAQAFAPGYGEAYRYVYDAVLTIWRDMAEVAAAEELERAEEEEREREREEFQREMDNAARYDTPKKPGGDPDVWSGHGRREPRNPRAVTPTKPRRRAGLSHRFRGVNPDHAH